MARILIVDDEPLIALLAEEWLMDLGHVVVGPACDLAAALALIEGDLDGAILDVSLGSATSYPAARRLRERGVPFAFASGYELDPSEPEHQGVPMLAKPFEFEAFRTAIEAMLRSAPR